MDHETNGKYFGPPELRKDDEDQIDTPVGSTCVYCDELIQPDDMGSINFVGQVFHYECSLRAVVGSVGHQMKRCSCFGGTEEDPPGLTRHAAALAATRLWHMTAPLERAI